MPGELEYSEHAEHSERDEGTGNILVVRYAQSYVVRQYSHHVYDGHDAPAEPASVRSREQPQPVLHGEDENAGGIQTEEANFVPETARLHGIRAWDASARYGFEDVGSHLVTWWCYYYWWVVVVVVLCTWILLGIVYGV